MKTISIVVLVLSLAGLFIGCQQKQTDIVKEMYPDEQKQIEKLVVHDIFDSAKAKDFDRLEAFHLLGPKFTKFDDWEPLTRQDAQTAMKAERDAFSGVSDFNYNILDLKADVFGDVAIATFVADYSMKAGDTPIAAKARSTLVFVKDGGAWKIAHEHFSPFKSNP
jgi:ketosteroid isomerase-like protein